MAAAAERPQIPKPDYTPKPPPKPDPSKPLPLPPVPPPKQPSVNRTVPRRLKNKDLRTREHLTEKEVERLIKAAGDNRYGHRDATMVLIAFRHGLRVSELCDLDSVEFRVAHQGLKVSSVSRPEYARPSYDPYQVLRRISLVCL